MEIPELQTARLKLRAFRETDLDGYAAMCADPEVAAYLGGPATRGEAWRSMAQQLGHWVLRGFGQWAVVDRAEDRFLGRCGLFAPEGWPGIEVGWMFSRAAWGHGYATEAAAAASAWAFETLGLSRLISVIDPANARSIAVAERLGMVHAEEWASPRGPTRIYATSSPPPG